MLISIAPLQTAMPFVLPLYLLLINQLYDNQLEDPKGLQERYIATEAAYGAPSQGSRLYVLLIQLTDRIRCKGYS